MGKQGISEDIKKRLRESLEVNTRTTALVSSASTGEDMKDMKDMKELAVRAAKPSREIEVQAKGKAEGLDEGLGLGGSWMGLVQGE